MKTKVVENKKFVKVQTKEPKVKAMQCGGGPKCNEAGK